MSNLWPDDISGVDIKAPVSILREQASLLAERTKGIATAEVVPLDVEIWSRLDRFRFAFVLSAPSLGGYQYQLFTVSYDTGFYPASFEAGGEVFASLPDRMVGELTARGMVAVKAESEAEFEEILRAILGSPKTKEVVRAILAQSQAVASDRRT
jgi:hypothetical protein